MNIHGLIYFEKQNQGAVIRSGKGRRWVFAASVVLAAAGTVLLMSGSGELGLTGAGCVIVGLYGFFISFASGVPAFFDRRPARKYKGVNLLVFRTLTAKLATMGVLMATISMIFTATLMAEGTGLVLRGLFMGRMSERACFDLYIGGQVVEVLVGHGLRRLGGVGQVVDGQALRRPVRDHQDIAVALPGDAALEKMQLSESERYRRQFALLQKLGMDRRDMARALGRQFFLYYALPAVPPVLIGVPFILNLAKVPEPGVMVGPRTEGIASPAFNSPLMIAPLICVEICSYRGRLALLLTMISN